MQEKSKHGFTFALAEVAWEGEWAALAPRSLHPTHSVHGTATCSRAQYQWTLSSDGPPVSAHSKAGST